MTMAAMRKSWESVLILHRTHASVEQTVQPLALTLRNHMGLD